jgi:hypothetical protein
MKEEELKGLTLGEVIHMDEFRKEMEWQVSVEERTQTEAIKQGYVNRTPLDSLREKGVFNADKLIELYEAILNKSLLGFSSTERQYIERIALVVLGRVLKSLRDPAEGKDLSNQE